MTVPTTKEVTDLIVAQLESKLSQTIPLLPKAFLRVLAAILSGVFILLWKYAGFIFLQMFVADATMQETTINGKVRRPLVEWGRLIGVEDPQEATRAEHIIAVGVTNQTGSLAAGAQLIDDNGVVHETVSDVALNAPLVPAKIRAISGPEDGDGTGTIGNLEDGTIFSFARPYPNVASEVFVASREVSGVDAETETSYRTRIINRFQARPQGGAYADYRLWGEEVEGVAHIYPYTGNNPGEVDIYVEVDTDVEPDGIPDQAHLDAVFDAIELNDDDGTATRRPVNAAINVFSIVRVAWDVEVYNLQVDDPTSVKADLKSGIDEYFRSREPFIVGLSVLPRSDRITKAAVGGIVDTIVNAAGGTVDDVIIKRGGVSLPAWLLERGEKAKLFSDPIYL